GGWRSNGVLHGGQDVLGAGDWPGRGGRVGRRGTGLEGVDGFGDAGHIHPFKVVHALLLSPGRAIRILSGVIGSSRTRAPEALKTALAIAPIAGMMAASAIPMTTSRLSPSSIKGSNSGISSVPGN